MAHFAKLGTGNIITAIHTVNNNELLDENGVEQEAKGVAFLNTLFPNPNFAKCAIMLCKFHQS